MSTIEDRTPILVGLGEITSRDDSCEAIGVPAFMARAVRAAALDAVPAARAAWDAFPPSTRKFGISQVDMARRPDTRAARIEKIVADAAEGKRP